MQAKQLFLNQYICSLALKLFGEQILDKMIQNGKIFLKLSLKSLKIRQMQYMS